MTGHDAEIELLKQRVSCAALLERWQAGWRLDRRGRTPRALKYRRGKGKIIIVNHDSRGWWDPQSEAKGDVFALVQRLDPSLNFGHVRQVLWRFVGIAPSSPEMARPPGPAGADRPVATRWGRRPPLRPGSDVWTYLVWRRCAGCLPPC